MSCWLGTLTSAGAMKKYPEHGIHVLEDDDDVNGPIQILWISCLSDALLSSLWWSFRVNVTLKCCVCLAISVISWLFG